MVHLNHYIPVEKYTVTIDVRTPPTIITDFRSKVLQFLF